MRGNAGITINSLDDLVILMFLEPDEKPPTGLFSKLIHYAVLYAQPHPAMAHVELYVPSEVVGLGGYRPPHFATYNSEGEVAGWRNAGDGYYRDNIGKFRAVPFVSTGIGRACLRACNSCCGAPYSLSRYLTTVPIFRAFARLFGESPKSPAHCAVLTTRVIKMAAPSDANSIFPGRPSTYGPSRTYLAAQDFVQRRGVCVGNSFDNHVALDAIKILGGGTDAEVLRLDTASVDMAIRGMAAAVYTAPHTNTRQAQSDLAAALIRLSYTRHDAAVSSDVVTDSETRSDSSLDMSVHLLSVEHT